MHFQYLTCRRQVAGLWVNLKDHDVIGVLVGRKQVGAAGSYFKVARLRATGWDGFQESGHAGCRVDGENGDAVVAAVRAIREFAVRVHLDFRRSIVSLEALGQS